ARQHCDALIKEEIDEPQRDDASHRAAILEERASGRRRRDLEQNGLDCSTGSRHHQQQQQQRRFAKRFKRHHPEVGENLHRRHNVASPSVSMRSDETFDEQTEHRACVNGPSVLDDVREALALRRSTANHTEVPARQKPTYNANSEEDDEEDDGERRRAAVTNREVNEVGLRTPLRDEDEDDEEDVDGGSEDNELDLKVDGRLSAIATTLDSEYHKRMAAAGVLAAAAAASASALGDAGSEQAAADFFAAHHKAGTHELALKQHFLNEKVRLQALLQRQAQQHQHHHQKLAGFLLSTATTPPTPTLTPTNVLNLGQTSNSDHQRGSSASPATTAGGRSSVAAGNGESGSCGKPSNSKQQPQTSCNSSPSPASSAAAVAAAAAAADRLFAAAYSNSASATGAGSGTSGTGAGSNVGSGNAGNGQVYLLPCPLCEVPLEPRVFRQHLDRHYPRDSPVCPVIQCGRRFAHPNSVRNHMRLKHTNQWAQMKAMRSSGEMRVRATDPRPCPKCGKIYRSAHTLRTHLEDKHTVCPGYRCVLCGTVAKSRNSLHSHMSRQHRGISTKDLPVLPMPSPFDPELASRLLAKAGVKISPAELRARASPTGTRRNDGMKLELRSGDGGEDFDDPEDLTMSQSSHSESQRRFHESMMGMSPTGFNHLNSTTITRVRPGEGTPKLGLEGLGRDGGNGNGGSGTGGSGGNGNGGNGMGGTDRHGGPGGPMNHMQSNTPTGSAILDTYLQFITENAFGMSGMTQEQAAAAALQAAKIAHLKTLGHNLDQLPPGFLPPQLDLAKLTSNNNQINPDLSTLAKLQSSPNVTIEPTGTGNRSNETDRLLQTSNHQKLLALAASGAGGVPGSNPGNHGLNNNNSILNSDAIRRGGSSEPMDLGLEGSGAHDDDGNSSADERNYSDDESIATH
uniref:C2H2-type domain-containing protein n=1 Tax=Anopheles minimus TaxID=112268 RepID=A0A182W7B7_9DIPT